MKAFILKKFAIIFLPTTKYEQGVYEFPILPISIMFKLDKPNKYWSITVYVFHFPLITIIKTILV